MISILHTRWLADSRRAGGGALGRARAAGVAEEARGVLARAARYYTDLHIAPGTRGNYDVGVRSYAYFAVYFRPHEPVFPATEEALRQFVTFQSQSCQYSTLKNYLYGIREYHLARGMPFAPLAEQVGLWWTLRGIRRVHGRPARPKQALTFPILYRVWRAATDDGQRVMAGNDHTVFAAMVVGMFGLLRKNNLTAAKGRSARDDVGLRRGDVYFATPAGGGSTTMWLRIRSSKTNQFGERVHKVPFVEIGGPLCPVGAVRRVLAEFQGGPDDYLFMWRPAGGRRPAPMAHSIFVKRMKGMLGAAGEDPSRFAGHSLRRGGATLAFTLGIGRHLIKMHGDWLSDVVEHYNEMDAAARLVLPNALARYVASLQA